MAAINLKNFRLKKLTVVIALVFLILSLNFYTVIHNVIMCIDIQTALRMNSLIGMNHAIDQILAWLSTRIGDAFVLSIICIMLFIHSLCGSNLNEIIRRGAFWLWIGLLCIATYIITCLPICTIARNTPMLILDGFKNLQTLYGFTFHSCPTSCFPSGHGFAYIFFAMMAWKRYSRISLTLWCMAIIMLSMRLVVGLHWLSDIIFGSFFLSLFVIALIEDTRLKSTYKYVYSAVAYLVKSVLAWVEQFFNHFILHQKSSSN